ncbi:MAG: hypothetical protein AAF974_02640 [Cyanobacteria bacterium P01_E01_bin.34]
MTRSPQDSPDFKSNPDLKSGLARDSNPDRNPELGHAAEQSLTTFLQANTPTPPPTDPTLRSQILTEIANHPHVQPRRVQVWWLLPPAIAAAMLASWLWPRPAVLTADERLDLETYLISSWTAGTSIETDPLDDWLEDGDPDWFDEF